MRYSDGSYRCTLLGEVMTEEPKNWVHFQSSHEAQHFTSNWYSRTYA